MRKNLKSLIMIALLSVPAWISSQTVYRFMFWESANGVITEIGKNGIGSKSSEFFIARYFVDGSQYSVKSSVGSNALPRKYKRGYKLTVLFDYESPNNAVVAYRYGQLDKMFLSLLIFAGLAGGLQFVSSTISKKKHSEEKLKKYQGEKR